MAYDAALVLSNDFGSVRLSWKKIRIVISRIFRLVHFCISPLFLLTSNWNYLSVPSSIFVACGSDVNFVVLHFKIILGWSIISYKIYSINFVIFHGILSSILFKLITNNKRKSCENNGSLGRRSIR